MRLKECGKIQSLTLPLELIISEIEIYCVFLLVRKIQPVNSKSVYIEALPPFSDFKSHPLQSRTISAGVIFYRFYGGRNDDAF